MQSLEYFAAGNVGFVTSFSNWKLDDTQSANKFITGPAFFEGVVFFGGSGEREMFCN